MKIVPPQDRTNYLGFQTIESYIRAVHYANSGFMQLEQHCSAKRTCPRKSPEILAAEPTRQIDGHKRMHKFDDKVGDAGT